MESAQPGMAAQAESPETGTRGGMFVRRSTGLTRDISFFSQIMVNIGPAAPGVGLAASTFVVLAAYPGGHLVAALWITALLGLILVVPYGILSMVMPRSGADYILVSRSIGPPFGMASSFSLVMFQFIGIAFLASTFVTIGLAPGFATIGLVTHHPSFIHTATTISSHGWTFALSALILFVAMGIAALPNHIAMKIQNTCYGIAFLGLAVGVIVMLATTQGGFTHTLNATAGSNAYEKIIKAAPGVAALNSSWNATVPAIGALCFVFLFSWWTTNYGGEIRGARTWRNLGSMAASLLLLAVVFSIVTLALTHMVGGQFLTAANTTNGTSAYVLSVPPFWQALAAIGAKSSALAVFLIVTFLFWFPIWVFINLAVPTRAFFAWSFDGLLPRNAAYVSPNLHSPLVALAITGVLSLIALAITVYTTQFNTVLALLVMLFLVPPASVAMSLALLPWLRPHLWKRSALSQKVAGIPVATIVGLIAVASEIFVFWIFVHYRALGLHTHLGKVITLIVVFYAIGFLWYYVAKAIQARRGVDISLNYAEIPPE